MLSKITLGLTFCSVATLVACGGSGGFVAPTSLITGGNQSASTGPGGGDTDLSSTYETLQYKGYVNNGSDTGFLVVDIDKTNNALLLILPLQMQTNIDSTEGQVTDVPGVTYMTYKDTRGAYYIAVSVPLRYVLKGASFLKNSQRLPNGDPLPQIVGGELPGLGLKLPGKDAQFYLYIGVDTVCLYVSSPFDPYFSITSYIRNNLTTIGAITSVPAKAGFNGGFFMSTQMPKEVAQIIDDHFHF